MRRSLGFIALALALVFASSAAPHAATDVVVSAAASLADVLDEAKRMYQSRVDVRVAINVAASNTLARQIAAGAPVDLFISADEAQMDAIRDQIVAGSRVVLLTNQLAIAVPTDRPHVMVSARDLLAASIRRVAIGDPAAVPAGVYAKQYLQGMGLWQLLQPKLVPSGSVRLALAAVESGGADAAIVYATDVAIARRARTALVIPVGQGPRIEYPAALIRGGAHIDAARRFLAFLRGDEMARVFTRAGFGVVR
jgi:molybdate transport system substrate-binding protein